MAIANLVVRIAADIADFEKNISAAERVLQKTGRNLEQIGTQLTKGLTVPLVAIGGVAAKAAIDFESSFAGVRKTVDATEEQFKKLESAFRELAKTMPASVNEINRVAEAAGQVGVHQEDILAFTETMIKLGTATNLTAEEAAVGMQKFANALGQPRIDMEKLGSALVDLGNNGAATERQILELAGRMAGTGASIRLTAGEIFGMANALAGVAIDAEKGGSAISRLFKDIEKAAEQGGTQLKEFAKVAGLTSEEFSKLFKADSAAVITAFIEGLGRMKAAGESLNPVLEKLGITELRYADTVKLAANASDQFAASVSRGKQAFNENTALQNEYAERLKTTASQLIILKNNVMDAAITLGQAMLPAINRIVSGSKPFIDSLAGLAEGFKSLPGPIRDVSLAFLGLLAAAGPIVFIASQITKAWASLLAILRFLPVAIGAVSTAFIAIAGAMGATTTGLRGVAGAMVLLRSAAAALLAPLAAIPIAIVGIIATLPKAQEGLRNMNAAVTTGRFWDFVTTKDAPGIWEGEFWGMSRGADAAAESLANFSTAGTNVDRMLERQGALKTRLSGDDLKSQVFDLSVAFANLDPKVQRSADTIKRTGEEALRLRDAGAVLTPELEKLANKAVAAVSREMNKAAKEADEYAELLKKIKDAAVPISESDKKRALELHELGLSYKGIAQVLKVNEFAIQKYVEWQEKLNDLMREEIPILRNSSEEWLKRAQSMSLQADLRNTEQLPTLERSSLWAFDLQPIVLTDAQKAQLYLDASKTGKRVAELLTDPIIKTGQEVWAEWSRGLSTVADSMRSLARVSDSAFGRILNNIAQGIDAINEFGTGIARIAAGDWSGIAGVVSGVVGLFDAIFQIGPTDYERRVRANADALRELRDAANDAAGGFANLEFRARLAAPHLVDALRTDDAAFLAIVLDELDEAFGDLQERIADTWGTLVDGATGSGQLLDASLAPFIQQLRDAGVITDDLADRLLDLTTDNSANWRQMEDIAKRYGVELSGLGATFQQQKLTDIAGQIIRDFDLLINNGADFNAVLHGFTDEIQEVVTESLKFGTEIPENMRPWIQRLIDAKKLLDENGDAITDIDRLDFGPSILSDVDKLVLAIQDLIDAIRDGLPDAIRDLGNVRVAPIRIPVEYDVSGFEGRESPALLASGGIVRRPTLAIVGESGPEAVVPLSQLSSVSPDVGSSTVIFEVDGRVIAEATVPHIPGVVRRYVAA